MITFVELTVSNRGRNLFNVAEIQRLAPTRNNHTQIYLTGRTEPIEVDESVEDIKKQVGQAFDGK